MYAAWAIVLVLAMIGIRLFAAARAADDWGDDDP